ncbi:hypothetical protein [Persephonella sp.]
MIYRFILIFYILTVVSLTLIHDYRFFVIFIIILSVIAGKKFLDIFKKAILSIFLINSVVSVSYILLNYFRGFIDYEFLVLFNLRVFSITFLTFIVFEYFNIFKLLNFSKSLIYILVITISQINTFKRVYLDFNLALKSRTIEKVRYKDLFNFLKSLIFFFSNKAVKNSKEITQAMRSRGFFIDQ